MFARLARRLGTREQLFFYGKIVLVPSTLGGAIVSIAQKVDRDYKYRTIQFGHLVTEGIAGACYPLLAIPALVVLPIVASGVGAGLLLNKFKAHRRAERVEQELAKLKASSNASSVAVLPSVAGAVVTAPSRPESPVHTPEPAMPLPCFGPVPKELAQQDPPRADFGNMS